MGGIFKLLDYMLITSTVVLGNILYNTYAFFLNSIGASSLALTYIFLFIGQVIALLLL